MGKISQIFDNPAYENEETDVAGFPPRGPSQVQNKGAVEVQQKTLTKDETLFKWGILKNVLIISFAFTCLFTSFNSMVNLQSSINKELGTTSLWVLYAALVFSCAFLPTLLIKKLKVKWTLAISMLCYSSYMGAQFYPRYYTLIPTAIILGLGAAPMWSAKCTYLTVVGEKYGELVGENKDVIITRFFGIFFLFFQSSQVIGNFISSAVLSQGVVNSSRSEEFLDHCGANFCPSFAVNITASKPVSNSTEADTDHQKKILLSSIYLVCSLASSGIIVLLVDSLTKYGEGTKSQETKSGLQLLMATFKHLKNPYQILIIPLTFWSGTEQGFLGADFTAGFVTCGLGVHMVGYVMICYGVCDAICSLAFTPLVKSIGRIPIFLFGAALNVSLMILMLVWRPHPDQLFIFFLIAALWGVTDAIWQTQINAFYGVIFPGASEAAFSNYRLWESLGYILAYNLSSLTCMATKIYVNFFILLLGMIGYLTIEIMEMRKMKNATN